MSTPTLNPLGGLYQIKTSLWPTLQRKQIIPDHLASPKRDPSRPSIVGLGIVQGICVVLSEGRVTRLGFNAQRWSLGITSSTTPGVVHSLGGARSGWYVEHHGYLMATCALSGILTTYRQEPTAQETLRRYQTFVDELTTFLGVPPPYTAGQFTRAAWHQPATDALMALADEIYFFSKSWAKAVNKILLTELPDPNPLPNLPDAIARYLYLQTAPSPGAAAAMPRPAQGDPSLETVLCGLIARGGTGLLFGPTSGGKSTAVRRAAVEAQAQLIVVRGRPNLDDRQLYGGITTRPGGYEWVDGPLTEAWRLATTQRCVLLVDELLRFDPYYLNAFVGALDRLRGDEVLLLPRLDDEARRALRPEGWYYVLDVPTGERLVAPAEHLTVIATTNFGSDYLQATQIDTALLNRFQVRMAVDRLDRARRLAILGEVALPPGVEEVLADMEEFSVTQCGTHGGLLQRPLTLRTIIDWATEARALMQEQGSVLSEALLLTARYTIIPYACPWLDTGAVESAPAQVVLDHLRQLIIRYRLP